MEPATRSSNFVPLDEELNDTPIEEVKSIVSIQDDPAMVVWTIRVMLLAPIVCILEAYFCAIALIKKDAVDLNMLVVQFGILGCGRAMEKYLPNKVVPVPWTRLRIKLNPGPFNEKEHVLINVAGYMGRFRPHVLQTVVLAKGYYGISVYLSATIIMMLLPALISFSFADLFRNWVTSPEMWWPSKLVDVMFFRTWHQEIHLPTGTISNRKFFYIFAGATSVYQVIPSIFTSLSSVSPICFFWKRSVRAQQIGSGLNGMGAGAFSLDWASISSFTGDPLSMPRVLFWNAMAGFFINFFVITPAIYWTNSYDTQKFAMFSTKMFDSSGNEYDINRVMNGVAFDVAAYAAYSIVYLSAFRIASYASLFASIPTSFVHVLMNYVDAIWKHIYQDVHYRKMQSYEPVPRSWFYIILVSVLSLLIGTGIMDFGPDIQLPSIGILIACLVVVLLLPPVGTFAATTNLILPVNFAFVLVGGFLYPSQQFQYMIFNNSAYEIALRTVALLGFNKLGHYMKVPHKAMFIVQLVASLLGGLVSLGVIWSNLDMVKNECTKAKRPVGSPGNCPSMDIYYSTTNIWGILGSKRIIWDGGYTGIILFVACISTVADLFLSLLSRKWTFLKHVKLPIVLAATSVIPPATPANINSWLFVGIVVLPHVIPRIFAYWSSTHQYFLSLSFTTGTAVATLLGLSVHMIMNLLRINIAAWWPWWGSEATDPCPLARCPTAPGIVVDGCPVMT